jgi:Restriction Endonuclease associating with ARP
MRGHEQESIYVIPIPRGDIVTEWSTLLRDQLRANALAYSRVHGTPCYESKGRRPTIVFEEAGQGLVHGNFHPAAFHAIKANPAWKVRLAKPHPRANTLPAEKSELARELDSSNSSDALLMNCFCFPGSVERILADLGISPPDCHPEFGFKARVPLTDGREDATEIDMKIGRTLFEAKLTERDFTCCSMVHLARYRDSESHFDVSRLPSDGPRVRGYQLIRNVLAAAHHDAKLIVLLDQRRPDLLQEWWEVHAAIKSGDLRSRCGFRTWQQVAAASPPDLAEFLNLKYGL